jgi:hypothetical protein
VARCEARYRGTGIAKIALEFESTDWSQAARRATIEIDWNDDAERARGAEIFAIAGNPISDDRDAERAAQGMRGREFYVEVTREGRIHVQQLATTHRMTSPMIAGRGRIADDGTRNTREFTNLRWPLAAMQLRAS